MRRARYEQQKKAIEGLFEENKLVLADTNVLIFAAENDYDFLQELQTNNLFKPTNINLNEIYGLTTYGRLGGRTAKRLQKFADAVQRRQISVPIEQVHAIEDELYELAPLLPRSVAHHVVIKFVEQLIDQYAALQRQAAQLAPEQLKAISKSYQESVKKLPAQAEDHYFNLIDELDIPEFDEDVYFEEVNKFITNAINDIQNAVTRSGGDIRAVIRTLDQFKNKTHNNDIRMVAQAITQGTKTVSMDSDVRWLFAFYALRNAA